MTIQAQTSAVFTGRIVDAEFGQGLEGVNFRLNSTGQHFMTDSGGYYRWVLPEAIQSDSVRISCIGYHSISRTLAELKSATLMLSPRTYTLSEVVIQKRKPKTRILNGYSVRKLGERVRVPFLDERQTDMIGLPFIGAGEKGKFTRIRSVQVIQEGVNTSNLSWFRSQQRWRFRLRILEADEWGRPSDNELLKERIIITVSDVDYQIYERARYDPKTNSTLYTNRDFSEKTYYGIINIDLRPYNLSYPTYGVFVFLELLPPVISGGDRLFNLAKMDVGNTGWLLNGRSRQWSRGIHFVQFENGKVEEVNIEPAIALELME